MGDPLEEVVRIHAVIVRERDEVRANLREGRVSSTREAPDGAEMLHLERWVVSDHLLEPVVLVLVDDHDAETAVRLATQRC